MRKFSQVCFAILLFILFVTVSTYSQTIKLPQNWLLKVGDDITYKEPGYDDSKWQQVNIPTTWEANGHAGYDGYGWFRVHFKIDTNNLPDELYLLLGKIDDIDETYLNGQLVGASGQVTPEIRSEWNTQRVYKIPQGLLKKDNVIAIRVYDYLYDGGIQPGYIGLYNKEEYIKELRPGPAPKKSFFQVSTANGLIAAVYNEKKHLIETVSPHMFKMYDENKPVSPFISNLKLNTEEIPSSVNYLQNTHIINITYRNFSLKLLAPFLNNEKVFYAVLEGNEKDISNLYFTYDKNKAEVLTGKVNINLPGGKMRTYFLFSFNDSLHNNSTIIKEAAARLKNIDLVEDELNFMRSVINKAYKPAGLTVDETNLYEQSISILKMAQVSAKEIFPKSHGQILASLPPGGWNIGWLRDGVYAIMALNRLGLFDEAKVALNFYLNADAGYYVHYVHTDGIDHGVKTDYRLSICRYFGIGKEESDFNNDGPNIELDGFGLFLTGLCDYVNRSNDVKFLKDNFDVLSKLIADPILTFIVDNDLIRIESGPWESHLPGKQYAFTSMVNSAGLKYFAELCKENNLPGYEKFFEGSERLKKGIEEHLIYEDKLIKGFAKADSPKTLDFFDGGTIEAFNFDVIQGKEFFDSYYKEYSKGLEISDRRGFSRLNNPDWYTIGEWPFLNMRFSSSLLKYGKKEEASRLINWTTGYSKMNFNYIAELYDYKNENYDGAIPMVGYGAGAYIITLCDYYSK